MQKAIIHTATRVIRRLTTDDPLTIALDETVIDLAQDIDLAGGFWKLDNQNNKVAASQAEIDASGVDEEKVALNRRLKVEAYKTAMQDAITSTSLANLKKFLQALKDIS